MRYPALLLSLLALSCSGLENMAGESTSTKTATLTEATVMDQNGVLLKTITDEKLLKEISTFWRGKVPAGADMAMSNDCIVRLACSDGNESTWYYDARGYVMKSSQRDSSIYNIANNKRLLDIISP